MVLLDSTSSFVLEAVTGTPAAAFLYLFSLSLSLSSGSGINKELIARRTFRGAGSGAGVPSHGGRWVSLSDTKQSRINTVLRAPLKGRKGGEHTDSSSRRIGVSRREVLRRGKREETFDLVAKRVSLHQFEGFADSNLGRAHDVLRGEGDGHSNAVYNECRN